MPSSFDVPPRGNEGANYRAPADKPFTPPDVAPPDTATQQAAANDEIQNIPVISENKQSPDAADRVATDSGALAIAASYDVNNSSHDSDQGTADHGDSTQDSNALTGTDNPGPPQGPSETGAESRENSWEENAALASAMAQRFMIETTPTSVTDKMKDMPAAEAAAAGRMFQAMEQGMNILFLRHLEEPGNPVTGDADDVLFSDHEIGQIVRAFEQEDDEKPDPSYSPELRAAVVAHIGPKLRSHITALAGNGVLEWRLADNDRVLPAVRQVAIDHNTTDAAVILDDGLYAQSVQTAYGSAENHARELFARSREGYEQTTLRNLERATIDRLRNESGDMRPVPELLADIRRTPAWSRIIAETSATSERGTNTKPIVDQVRRIWRQDALEFLPPDLRHILKID